MRSSGADGKRRRRFLAALALVVIAAAGVRAGYLIGLEESPFFKTPLGDAAANLNRARDMARTVSSAVETAGILGEEPLRRPPLYPMALSVAVQAGDELTVARWGQATAGVIVAALVFIVGTMLLGLPAGLIGGLLCALYGPAVYYDAQFLPGTLMLLTYVCYWITALGAWRRGSVALWLLSGLLLGVMAGLSIGAFVLALPAMILAWRGREQSTGPRPWIVAAALVVGAAIAVSPFVIHNARAGAAAVVVARDGGISFYTSNNPNATGLPPSLAGEDTWWHGERYAAAEAAAKSGSVLGPAQLSRYWFFQGLRFVVKHPLQYAKLLGRKLAHFWGRPELVTGPSPSFVSENWVPWSGPLMYGFAALGALALAGIVAIRRKSEAPAILFPLIGALAFGLVYTSEASTRLLALPSLTLLAGAFVLHLASEVRRRRWKGASAAVLALATAAAIVNLLAPWVSGAALPAARDHRLLGVVYNTQGRGPLALDQYDKAARMAPGNSSCRLSLAAMLASDGVADEAQRHFLAAAALDTLSPAPYLGLANLYRRNGLLEEALSMLEEAAIRAPYDVGLAVSLGRSCIDMGLYERAEAHLRAALSLDPENASAIDGLLELRDRGIYVEVQEGTAGARETVRSRMQAAMGHLRAGDMDASKAILDELIAEAPDDLDVVFALATWHLAAGNLEEAIKGYERCYESNPKNPMVINNLASAYHQTGRVEEAITMWERALALDPNNMKAKSNLERALAERDESGPQ